MPGQAIVDAVAAQPGIDPDRIGVWGVSLGGYYAPRVASGVRPDPGLRGPGRARTTSASAGTSCPPLTRTAFTARSFSADRGGRAANGRSTLDSTDAARAIRVPLLVVAGKQDRLIPWQHAERLVAEAGGPTELIMLEDGNHGNMNVAAQAPLQDRRLDGRQLGA